MRSLKWLVDAAGNDREKLMDLAYVASHAALYEADDEPGYLDNATAYHEVARLLLARLAEELIPGDLFEKRMEQLRGVWHARGTMTTERYNELLAGPLTHASPSQTIMRLGAALRIVLDASGGAARDALEQYCDDRNERDFREDHQ